MKTRDHDDVLNPSLSSIVLAPSEGIASGPGSAVIIGDGGNNTLAGTVDADTITGLGGQDSLYGNDGNDSIDGGDDNDTLNGGGGNDTLVGGVGHDTMYGGLGDDVYYLTPWDSMVEGVGEGVDTLMYDETYDIFGSNIENLTLLGTGPYYAIGDGVANRLTGNPGTNTLIGRGGNDTLDGGTGNDTLRGELDDDIYYVDSIGDNVVEAYGQGTDAIFASVSYSISGRYVELLTLTGASDINATGNSFAQTLTGNTGNNLLTALGGHDRLDGGTEGADTLVGGTGDDTYVITASGDTVTEAAGEGNDLVESAITYTLGSEVERLTLWGSANINGTGNGLNNVLTGNGGNNTLAGGLGDDTYYIQNAGDHVSEASGAGIDTVFSTVTYSLAGKQADNLSLTGSHNLNATGNGLANVLIGNGGNNILDSGAGHDSLNGSAGADTMIGGTGNDTYSVDDTGDVITEIAGGGADLVTAMVTYTLSSDVEALTLIGNAAINGTGNAGNNTLTGNNGNNVLSGGLGNDSYYVQNTGDNVVELGGEGSDVIFAYADYSLSGRYAETINLLGSNNLNATGNSLTNTLIGNDGINILNGKGGKDSLTGGLGADVFLFEASSGKDTITDFSAAQNDTINVNAYTGGVANNGLVAQVGGNVVITFSASNTITVIGANQADVLAHMVW